MGDIVKIRPSGRSAAIEINGLDVSEAVTSYDLRQRAGDIARLDISLATPPDFEGPAEVKIPKHTRAALIAMGWTAPPVSSPS